MDNKNCNHEYIIFPDRNLMFINYKCILCGHIKWWIEGYTKELEKQKENK